MHAIELKSFRADGLCLVERPEPAPQAGEVLIRIRAAALNYRDTEIAEGRYGMPIALPVVPLSDAVGDVISLGEGVTGFAVGDRVNPTFFPDWIDGEFRGEFFAHQLGGTLDGVLREFMTVPVTALVRAPSHMGNEAASLPIAALTAWSALTGANLRPGQTVLVIGTGGVSLFALQFAPLFGARAIVVSSEDDKIKRVIALGATAAVNYVRTPEWGQRVRELTDQRGVDVVVEVGGAKTFSQSIAALRVGGRMAIVGYASGAELQFDLRQLFIGKSATLQGHTVGSRKQFEEMNRALEMHRLMPVIDSIYTLQNARDAYARAASGQAMGKVLITL
jgi:NADPH:quinone reductase-like Zn-dependent oxidoreductase